MWQDGVHVPEGQTLSTNYRIWAEYIYPYVKSAQVYQCPSKQYTQAEMPYNTFPVAYNYNGSADAFQAVSLAAVEAPATTIMLYDGWTMDAWWPAAEEAPLLSGRAGPTIPWDASYWKHVRRHFDGANYAFGDGHVKWQNQVTPNQLTIAADPD